MYSTSDVSKRLLTLRSEHRSIGIPISQTPAASCDSTVVKIVSGKWNPLDLATTMVIWVKMQSHMLSQGLVAEWLESQILGDKSQQILEPVATLGGESGAKVFDKLLSSLYWFCICWT